MSKRREQKQDGQQALEHSKPAEAGAPGLRLCEAWIAGPTLLATIASVESMIWLWRTYWKRAPDPEMLKRYTSIALQLFQLDYDRPIYLGGALFCILLALTVCFLWTRRLRSSNGESPQFVRVVLFAHFPVAAAIILLPMLWMRSPTLNLLAAVFGFLFLVAAYVCEDRLAGLANGLEKFTQAYGSVVAAVLAAVIVIEFVGVSRLAELSGRTFLLDTYHHWDFYVMGPALACCAGPATPAARIPGKPHPLRIPSTNSRPPHFPVKPHSRECPSRHIPAPGSTQNSPAPLWPTRTPEFSCAACAPHKKK